MIRITIFIFAVVFCTADIFPHYMWIETDQNGSKGVPHKVKLFYGEYSYNYFEKTSDGFKDVNKFELWVISPDNIKTKLSCLPAEDHYYAEFIPESDGIYYLVMINETIDVVDWREWDMGILKPGFYASALVKIGNLSSRMTIPARIPSIAKFIVFNSFDEPAGDDSATLRIYYNKEILKEHELTAGFIEGWTRKLLTDSTGTAEFSAPWEGLYIIEAVYNDKIPGSYNGKEYEATRNVATYSIWLKK